MIRSGKSPVFAVKVVSFFTSFIRIFKRIFGFVFRELQNFVNRQRSSMSALIKTLSEVFGDSG
jgi:hypothetical protein